MNELLVTCVVPSFKYNVPPEIFVTLKCVTSVLSAALRLITKPDADCVSSFVDAFVIEGVSAIGVTEIVAVAVLPPNPPSLLDLEACTLKLPLLMESALGVNFNPALPCA